MRVLIAPGTYSCRNMGDVAMLQVAVSRLHDLLPAAQLDVMTSAPAALRRFCPAAAPLPVAGAEIWLADVYLLKRLLARQPAGLSRAAGRLRRALRHRAPALLEHPTRLWLRARGRDDGDLAAFVRALRASDLLVVSGQGGMSDATAAHARATLALIEAALARGLPIAMLGQGVGPLWDPELRAKAARVLPRVSLIALREARASWPLLADLGVPADRVVTTGDDAIELAHRARPAGLGAAIGVNVRVARNAGTDTGLLDALRPALARAAHERGAPLLGLPIAHHRQATNDPALLRALLGPSADGGDWADLDSPEQVIAAAGRCRLVVTGAYHAAVFALAQGVPVVALSGSAYYHDKFDGLAAQFGPGCAVVRLDEPGLGPRLEAAIARAWSAAEELRPTLLRAAALQVEQGLAAYRAAVELTAASGQDRRPAPGTATSKA